MQTTQTQTPTAARAGMLYGDDHVVDVKFAAAALLAGLFVCRNAADDACKVPTTAGEVQDTGFGFVVFDTTYAPADGATTDYDANKDVPVCADGSIWAVSEASFAVGDPVYVRIAAGTGTQKGALRPNSDGGTCALLPGARVLEASSSTDPVLVRLDTLAPSSNTAICEVDIPFLAGALKATGGPLVVFNDGVADGISLADSKALTYRWNNGGTPPAIVVKAPVLTELDNSAPAYLKALVSKSGATVGDATTMTYEVWAQVSGALHDADTDFGGASDALVGDAAAKTLSTLTRTLAAADLPAGPASLTITVKPTDGLLGTDDLMLHRLWILGARKR